MNNQFELPRDTRNCARAKRKRILEPLIAISVPLPALPFIPSSQSAMKQALPPSVTGKKILAEIPSKGCYEGVHGVSRGLRD